MDGLTTFTDDVYTTGGDGCFAYYGVSLLKRIGGNFEHNWVDRWLLVSLRMISRDDFEPMAHSSLSPNIRIDQYIDLRSAYQLRRMCTIRHEAPNTVPCARGCPAIDEMVGILYTRRRGDCWDTESKLTGCAGCNTLSNAASNNQFVGGSWAYLR